MSGKKKEPLTEMGKILLKRNPPRMPPPLGRFDQLDHAVTQAKYGSAPVYDKVVIFDEEFNKAWDELDEETKEKVRKNLALTCSRVQQEIGMGILCKVVNELQDKIASLEAEIKEIKNKTNGETMEEKEMGDLKPFFMKLLDLKQWLKEAAENSKDSLLNEAYEKLDAIIKNKEENPDQKHSCCKEAQ